MPTFDATEPPTLRPFFIVGCPRSGTTLLGVLLDRHSQLRVTPETAFYDEVAPLLDRDPTADSNVVLRNWRRFAELELDPLEVTVRVPPHGAPGSRAGALLRAILEAFADSRRVPRAGEKTPQHLAHARRILADFPDAIVWCIERDGRDVALSLAEMPWWRPRTLEDAADLWRTSIRSARELAAAFPGRFRRILHERLVADTEAELGRLMPELGLEFELGQLDVERPSGVVRPRSREWKGSALNAINPSLANHRRRSADPGTLALLDRLLSEELARWIEDRRPVPTGQRLSHHSAPLSAAAKPTQAR
jgi:hypothetical protein